MKNVQIVYFSGTGGTKRIARYLESCFIDRAVNCTVTDLDLHKNDYLNENLLINDLDCLVLLYAVYAFDAPPPVYDWLNRLTTVQNIPAAVLSVSGGGEGCPNTACRAGSIRILQAKGFTVFYERMFIMPANVLVKPREDLFAWLIQILPQKAGNCADEILNLVNRRTKPDILSRFLAGMSGNKSFGSFARHFRTSGSCTGCGWCAENCPRKNIEIRSGKPVFSDKCTLCLRCFYGCPKKAISSDKYKAIMLKTGFSIEDLERRLGHTELIPLKKLKTGFIYFTYRKYLHNLNA